MMRLDAFEITDSDLPVEVLATVHHDLTRTNRWLGNTRAIVRALRRGSRPGKVLDIGCGDGGMLLEIQRQLAIDVVGVDLRPPEKGKVTPIIRADAVMDPLPDADVAICVLTAHHFAEIELIALIRKVERSCRRLIILDLVRNRLPLILFRCFVAPFVSKINAADGCLSVQRAYTTDEFRTLIERALKGTSATYTHSVAPLNIRQIVDITYKSVT